MKRPVFLSVFLISMLSLTFSQFSVLKLYEREVPELPSYKETEIWDTTDLIRVRNIIDPDIAVYLPPERVATRQAVVICPGGGYVYLSYQWEGTEIAKWFNSKGIAAIVLKYRLPSSVGNFANPQAPLADIKRAVRMVRKHALDWNIDVDKIGIMGFSAGGHLASTLLTHFDYGLKDTGNDIDTYSCKPDFAILIYPVISMYEPYVHKGSRDRLLGKDTDDQMLREYSAHLNIKDDTPPVFLVHSSNDKTVPSENSILLYQALIEKNIPVEMHIYPYGGHGFGLGLEHFALNSWTSGCIDWLKWLNKK